MRITDELGGLVLDPCTPSRAGRLPQILFITAQFRYDNGFIQGAALL